MSKLTLTTELDDGIIQNQTLKFGGETYKLKAGEPEDNRFGRDLEDLDTVVTMLEKAHELGKQGISLEVVKQDEEW